MPSMAVRDGLGPSILGVDRLAFRQLDNTLRRVPGVTAHGARCRESGGAGGDRGLSLPSRPGVRVLDELVAVRGGPTARRTNNGADVRRSRFIERCAVVRLLMGG